MSWSEARQRVGGIADTSRGAVASLAGRAVAPLVCLLAAGIVAGCADGQGFRPLYGSLGSAAGVETKLAQVEIAPIPGRVGQRLRNELIFGTTGGAAAVPPVYRLEIAVKETLTSTLVKTDGDAQSQIYSADANFNLVRLSDKKTVLSGVSFGRAGLERNVSIFSNVRAQDDAQNRAAKTIGNDLRSRLAAYLSSTT
jgi:LPS-assembly lipoprotein